MFKIKNLLGQKAKYLKLKQTIKQIHESTAIFNDNMLLFSFFGETSDDETSDDETIEN